MAHEGIHICLHRFSFIYVTNDLWENAYICPIYAMKRTTKSAIYVMELTIMGWVSIGLKLNLHSWNKWIKVFLMNFKQEQNIDFIYSFVYNIYWVVGGKLY